MYRQPAPITVTFVDTVRRVSADEPEGLVFGRGAELDLDSNPFMHRQVGRFVPIDGNWWVENLSRSSQLWLTADGISRPVECCTKMALSERDSTVSFEAGSCRYELRVQLSEMPTAAPPAPPLDDQTMTRRPEAFTLTHEERLLVVALAEPVLRDPSTPMGILTNREVRKRLDWNTAKFNRKLDYLCARLERHGVDLGRVPGKRARDRRVRVIEYLVTERLVTVSDLDLLDSYPELAEGA